MTSPMLPIVILAGGLATRLRPLTTNLPKALIDINGQPFIAHQLQLLKSQGITDVILCVGYLGKMIKDTIGDGSAWGLHIQYSFDNEPLLGTAGSIKKALPLIQSNNFFILYGDSYLPCDFKSVQQYFIKAQKKSLMTVCHNQGLWDTSNVEFINHTIIKYDKNQHVDTMQHIDYGLGVCSKSAFDFLPEGTVFDLANLYQHLLSTNELLGFEIKERFYEIGSHSGIEEFSYFLSHRSKCNSSGTPA